MKQRYIIKTTRTAHCKRGPLRCDLCRKMDHEEICLLDIDPPDRGMVQRRVIEVMIEGVTEWREYDVVRIFANRDDALAYAEKNGIRY